VRTLPNPVILFSLVYFVYKSHFEHRWAKAATLNVLFSGLSDMWHDLVVCVHIHFNKTEETSQKDDYSVSR